MKHPIQREWADRDPKEQRRIDLAYCKKIFWESIGVSHIKETRKRMFVENITPHIRQVLPFWAYPFSRFMAVLIWDVFSLNFNKEAFRGVDM